MRKEETVMMDFSKFNISQKQTQRIAQTIFTDVEQYIRENTKEYEEFLQNELKGEMAYENRNYDLSKTQ